MVLFLLALKETRLAKLSDLGAGLVAAFEGDGPRKGRDDCWPLDGEGVGRRRPLNAGLEVD